MSRGVTIIAVHPAGERVRWFHAEVFRSRGLYEVELRWTRDGLEIQCARCDRERIEVQKEEYRSYGIRYPRLGDEANLW